MPIKGQRPNSIDRPVRVEGSGVKEQICLARRGIVILAVCLVGGSVDPSAEADEVRYYEQNGVTYQETRRKVQRPLVQTALTQQQQTVYRQQVSTEYRDVQRTYYVPITENRVQTYWHRRLNPFAPPYLAQKVVPVTRWELRGDVVKVPYTRTDYVPQVVTVQVPTSTQRMVEDEIITRVAVGVPQAPATFVAAQPGIGAGNTAVAASPYNNPAVAAQPARATTAPGNPLYSAPRNDLPPNTVRNFVGSAPSTPSAPTVGSSMTGGNTIGTSPAGNTARAAGGSPAAPIGSGNALPPAMR